MGGSISVFPWERFALGFAPEGKSPAGAGLDLKSSAAGSLIGGPPATS
jgi:hypothetical protein